MKPTLPRPGQAGAAITRLSGCICYASRLQRDMARLSFVVSHRPRHLAAAWGHTTTYGALANELGAGPEAARDVGQAMARNPVALIIPCHRVLAAGGKVGGFSARAVRLPRSVCLSWRAFTSCRDRLSDLSRSERSAE